MLNFLALLGVGLRSYQAVDDQMIEAAKIICDDVSKAIDVQTINLQPICEALLALEEYEKTIALRWLPSFDNEKDFHIDRLKKRRSTSDLLEICDKLEKQKEYYYQCFYKLGKSQYIVIGMSIEDMQTIANADETTIKIGIQRMYENNPQIFIRQIAETQEYYKNSTYQQEILTEICKAYNNSIYTLTAEGLYSLIDRELSDASKNQESVNLAERLLNLLERFDGVHCSIYDKLIVKQIYTALIPALGKTGKSLCFDGSNGDDKDSLNRHWLIHGRTKHQYTGLDCLKLLTILNGIIYLHKKADSLT